MRASSGGHPVLPLADSLTLTWSGPSLWNPPILWNLAESVPWVNDQGLRGSPQRATRGPQAHSGIIRPMPDEPPIKTLSTKIVFESRWTTLRDDEIERPGGHRGQYSVIEKRRAALVIPWDGKLLHLVRQWRYPTAQWSIEFPQGTISGHPDAVIQPEHDGDPEYVARAELREELGLRAGSLQRLGELAFAPGISNQFCDVWFATDLEHGDADPEPEEVDLITPWPVTPAGFAELLRDNKIVDAATMAAWAMATGRGLLPV